MAKDGTLRGGVRPNSGPKPKTLEQKILEGKVKPPIETEVEMPELDAVEVPEPRQYLCETQRGNIELHSKEIYKKVYEYLIAMKCEKYVSQDLVELYSQSYGRYMQVESMISATGFLAKHPTTNAPMMSPYVQMSDMYSKQVERIRASIDAIVREYCPSGYKPFDIKISEMAEILDS